MTELKECSRCSHKLDLSSFSLNPKGEYFKRCDTCRKKINEYSKTDKVKEYYKKYYEDNREKKNAQSRKWEQEHKDRLNEKVVCDNCGAITNRCNRFRHKHTKKCKEFKNVVT